MTRALNLDYTPLANSTLNEKLGIQSGVVPPAGSQPEIKYMAIGRGGHRNVSGAGGAHIVDVLQHQIIDAALFEQMPWVMRETTNDLTAAERDKYRLRRLENHNGTNYFCYYLKVIDISSSVPALEVVNVSGGVTTTTPYVPNAAQQNPTPVTMNNGVVNTSTGDHLVVSAPLTTNLDATDIKEIIDAAVIIHGDYRFATISEIAIVGGVDDTITSTDGGISATYVEAKGAVCCNFIGVDVNLSYSASSLDLSYRLSASQPWLT